MLRGIFPPRKPTQPTMPQGLPADFVEERLPGGIVLHARAEDIARLAGLFPEADEPFLHVRDARIVKRSRSRFVVRLSIPGKGGRDVLFCKRYRSRGWRDTLRTTLQGTRGLRELRSVLKAQARGITTAGIIAVAERLIDGFPHETFVLYHAIPNAPSLFDIVASWQNQCPPVSHRKALVSRVAREVADFQRRGLLHVDFSAKHLLVQNYPRTDGPVYVIDLDNAGFRERQSRFNLAYGLAQIARPLIAVGLRPADALRFLIVYLDTWQGNHHDWKSWWVLIREIIKMKKEHGGGLPRFWSAIRLRFRRHVS